MEIKKIKHPQKSNGLLLLFFSLYMVLPNYFALEINESFPLMTASRIILLICFFIIILKGQGRISTISLSRIDNKVRYYFLIISLVNILHIFDRGTSSINRLITIILEQYCVLWLIILIINTRERFEKAIRVLMYSSAVVAIISIVGFIFDTNFFYELKTVSRVMTQAGMTDIGYRNGLLRIEAGFGHPVYYGMYCSIMFFLSLYIYSYRNRKTSSLICMLLNVIALLLTNSRGSILAVAITFVISFFVNGWKERKKYLRILFIVTIIALVAFACSTKIREYVLSVFQSFFVYFGFKESSSINYGANMSFTSDRLIQFSGILWTIMRAPLIGFGYGAQSIGAIAFYNIGQWFKTTTFDVGYVEIFCCYGILGTIAHMLLLVSIIKNIKFIRRMPYGIMFRNIFIVYFFCLLSVVTIDKIFWPTFGLLLAYSNIMKLEKTDGRYS